VLPWLAAVPFAVWALVRVAGLDGFYPGVQLIAFTPYVAAVAPLAVAPALLQRRWFAAGLAGLAAVALAVCVLPRWVADADGAVAAGAGPRVRFLTANLLAGEADLDRLVAIVRDERVDVLAVQEFTPEALAGLDRAGLAGLLPHQVAYPQPSVTGSAVYSRFPLDDRGLRTNPGGFAQAMATLHVPGAPPVAVESVHPHAPSTRDVTPLTLRSLAGQQPATPGGDLRVLLGDFNTTVDHLALRRLRDTGYRDAASVMGHGLTPTWPYYGPRGAVTPKVALDHIFADSRIGVRAVGFFRVPRADHRAVLAELVLPAGG
jgi:endonuclease/exonuclease/phosphatase (EEP) superfamily protein YafD